MNDRTRWDDPRSEPGADDDWQGYRGSPYGPTAPRQPSQQDWGRQGRDDRQGQGWGQGQGWSQGWGRQDSQHRQQDWRDRPIRQQGAWHDDDYRRSGDYSGNEWRGERDWGSPGYGSGYGSSGPAQPQQREWRGSGNRDRAPGRSDEGAFGHSVRAWGGSSDRFGTRPTSSGSMHRDELGAASSHDPNRSSPDTATRLSQDRDVGARRGQDWYAHDSGVAGSQSFAAGYGMTSGANYDQWGAPARPEFGHSGGSDPTFGRGYGPDYGREEGRGFFERAGDEIASWFGDEEAARRREQDYRGHGPADYTRSDERIREDVNDRLTDDPRLDARRISVSVRDSEVTLSGVVGSRDAKRRAEDCIDRISGVRHVQNNLRVEEAGRTTGSHGWSEASTAGGASASGAATSLGASSANPAGGLRAGKAESGQGGTSGTAATGTSTSGTSTSGTSTSGTSTSGTSTSGTSASGTGTSGVTGTSGSADKSA